uniref:Uncharacterized protein n=1 Tax=Aegilops tauschii subsp. strangulata TaxID=200361 RepID=A0A452ZQI2_AEGTS
PPHNKPLNASEPPFITSPHLPGLRPPPPSPPPCSLCLRVAPLCGCMTPAARATSLHPARRRPARPPLLWRTAPAAGPALPPSPVSPAEPHFALLAIGLARPCASPTTPASSSALLHLLWCTTPAAGPALWHLLWRAAPPSVGLSCG